MISMPDSRMSSGFSRIRSALPPAAEELAEHFLEFDADRGEAFGEADAGVFVDLRDELFELTLGVDDVGELSGNGGLAFFELRLLKDGIEVHVAEAGNLAFEFADFGGDGVPVHFLGLVVAVGLVQIDLQLFHRVFDERFDADGELVFAEREFVLAAGELFDLGEDGVKAGVDGGELGAEDGDLARCGGEFGFGGGDFFGERLEHLFGLRDGGFGVADAPFDEFGLVDQTLEFHLHLRDNLAGGGEFAVHAAAAVPPAPWRRGLWWRLRRVR